jgi:hypothetical protein
MEPTRHSYMVPDLMEGMVGHQWISMECTPSKGRNLRIFWSQNRKYFYLSSSEYNNPLTFYSSPIFSPKTPFFIHPPPPQFSFFLLFQFPYIIFSNCSSFKILIISHFPLNSNDPKPPGESGEVYCGPLHPGVDGVQPVVLLPGHPLGLQARREGA